MQISVRELILNTLYSLGGGIFVFCGVYWGIKYSLLISIAYGVGFFLWSELFLYTLKYIIENNGGESG